MESFTRVSSVAAVLAMPNVDTDRIVPAKFLHNPRSAGYGQFLFNELRRDAQGNERPDFVLNQEPWRNARILIADANFGCGSSREGAVWALYGFGIRTVIASSFGDIFFENSFKNGLLPVVLPEAELLRLRAVVAQNPLANLEVDLEQQTVSLPGGEVFHFEVDAFKRNSLLLGLDDIGVTLQHLGEIESFERHRNEHAPWL
ncbi:MAG: 3-isopropylmalate dehydratase small subunit [Betaproteobacteria bacterium]